MNSLQTTPKQEALTLPKPLASFVRRGDVITLTVVLLVELVFAVWLGSQGYPVPRGDDAVYKSPAAELAQHG